MGQVTRGVSEIFQHGPSAWLHLLLLSSFNLCNVLNVFIQYPWLSIPSYDTLARVLVEHNLLDGVRGFSGRVQGDGVNACIKASEDNIGGRWQDLRDLISTSKIEMNCTLAV